MSRALNEQSVERDLGFEHYRSDQLERRVVIPDVVLFIKLFPDVGTGATVTTTPQFDEFAISEDMDGMSLLAVEMYVTTVSSSGKPSLQLERHDNEGAGSADNMLSTVVSIDASERNSKTAATPVVIASNGNEIVGWGDHVKMVVTIAGTGAKGLGLMLTFGFPSTE